jgi:hypothetical protein
MYSCLLTHQTLIAISIESKEYISLVATRTDESPGRNQVKQW